MRVVRFLPAGLCLSVFLTLFSCRGGNVLYDEIRPSFQIDSTSLRTFACVPDSGMIHINADADWTAYIPSADSSWLSISKKSGKKGGDSLVITVDFNNTTKKRKSAVIIEAGNSVLKQVIYQKAGEAWFDTPYWKRTAAQRLGLRGHVSELSFNTSKLDSYRFDSCGNLIRHTVTYGASALRDTVRVYTYDSDNHRLSCSVTSGAETLRTWRYEYGNKGVMVAFAATDWRDPNPLAENMTGMVVPDLSKAVMRWTDAGGVLEESRTYTFDEFLKLTIVRQMYRLVSESDTLFLNGDTLGVEYRHDLPYNSRYISNSIYYSNGMLRMLNTSNGKYEFLESPVRMVPSKYTARGESAMEWCSYRYNGNCDPIEAVIKYTALDEEVTDTYGPYWYDDCYNWVNHLQTVHRAGSTAIMKDNITRDVVYF